MNTQQVLDARHHLIVNMRSLRYSGQVQVPPPILDPSETEDEFLAKVNTWLEEYYVVLRTATDAHTDMASELDELRRQRAAIRSFLGITQSTGTT